MVQSAQKQAIFGSILVFQKKKAGTNIAEQIVINMPTPKQCKASGEKYDQPLNILEKAMRIVASPHNKDILNVDSFAWS